MRFARTTSALIILATTAAACSGGDSSTATTAAGTVALPTTSASSSTTSSAPATTTSTSSSTTSTSTTVPAQPVMPLTGRPITDPAVATRPAVVVKVSNDPGARPQSGLNDADIVFEAWGAGPTRFAAIFQSTDANPVGPIRSARTQDVDLVGEFNRPVFACSGGNPTVVKTIRNSDLQVFTEGQGPGWFLAKGRHRPHATFNDTASLRTNADPSSTAPQQQFHYLAAGQTASGDPSPGFDLHIEAVHVQWRYDAASNRYARSQDGGPHKLNDGSQVMADNVVVLWIDYDHSFADARSPDGGSIGNGEAWVFTNGKVTKGNWSRSDRLQPMTLADASGAPILLTPGSTWFELANTGRGAFPGSDELQVLPA